MSCNFVQKAERFHCLPIVITKVKIFQMLQECKKKKKYNFKCLPTDTNNL